MWCSKDSKILIILCLLAGSPCWAQYHPQYSQYMFNGLALNPAYAGSREVLNLATLYRSSQFGNSIAGAPVTYTFSGDFPLRNPQLALGLLVFDDVIGIYRQTGTYFAYAFRVQAGEGKLSFGLQAGFDLQRENQTNLNIMDIGDPLFDYEKHTTFMPNVGAGAYYYTPKYFVGLSIPQFLAYSPKKADYSGKLTFSNTMLYGGIIFPAGNNFKIKPSTLLQLTRMGVLFDLNCNLLMFDERLELGLSFRNSSTLVAMTQIRIYSQLCLGYAYDHALGKPTVINTSHEIMLRYDFNFKVKAASPLYLK